MPQPHQPYESDLSEEVEEALETILESGRELSSHEAIVVATELRRDFPRRSHPDQLELAVPESRASSQRNWCQDCDAP